MGATSSKKRPERSRSRSSSSAWTWSGPPGDHSPYPTDNIPYHGPDLLYCFVDFMARYQIMKNQINLGPAAVTTNVEHFLHEISDCYREGFLLNKFVRIPGVKMTTEVSDWSTRQPYQAILSQPTSKTTGELNKKEVWKPTVEKKILSTRTLAFDETDQENDLLNTIHRYASSGARLVCAEPVGYVRSDTTNTQYGIMGVELFFNVPQHPVDVKYTYHTVTIPAMYHIIPDDTQSLQQVVCDADFFGQLKVFLDTGWKLVDICMDSSAIADAYKLRAVSKQVETIWIFEKETSKLCEEEPLYEGVIIEYLHKVKVTLDGERPSRDWRPVIAGMGVTGWELATIIQTPLLIQSSFTTYTMKLLFFFQRQLKPPLIASRRRITLGTSGSDLEGTGGSGKRPDGPSSFHGQGRGGSSSRGSRPVFHGNNISSVALNGHIANGYVSVNLEAKDFRTSADNVDKLTSSDSSSEELPKNKLGSLPSRRRILSRTDQPVQSKQNSYVYPYSSGEDVRIQTVPTNGSSEADKVIKNMKSHILQGKKRDPSKTWTVRSFSGEFDDDEVDEENDDEDDHATNTNSKNGWSTLSSSSENGHGSDYGKLSVFSPIGIPTT